MREIHSARYENELPEEQFGVIITSATSTVPADAFSSWKNIREEYDAVDDGRVLVYSTERATANISLRVMTLSFADLLEDAKMFFENQRDIIFLREDDRTQILIKNG